MRGREGSCWPLASSPLAAFVHSRRATAAAASRRIAAPQGKTSAAAGGKAGGGRTFCMCILIQRGAVVAAMGRIASLLVLLHSPLSALLLVAALGACPSSQPAIPPPALLLRRRPTSPSHPLYLRPSKKHNGRQAKIGGSRSRPVGWLMGRICLWTDASRANLPITRVARVILTPVNPLALSLFRDLSIRRSLE